MMSFYGGPAGSSFVLKKIFRNKEEMKQDLDQRWKSTIGVGDFVFISYGLPSDPEDAFNINQQIDLDKYHKSYNSTLWQKIYLESANDQVDELTGVEKFFLSIDADKEANYGLGYRLITSMTGNTPKFTVNKSLLDAGEDPYINVDNANPDTPVITFYLPKTQKINYQELVKLDAGSDPEVIWDETTDVNNPKLGFKLPRGQKITYQGLTELDAGSPPKVVWDEATDVNNPKLGFELPKGQKIKLGTVTPIDAGSDPKVILDDTTDVNNPTLSFQLPKAQEIAVVDPDAALNADQEPYVTLDNENKATPKLTFHLPQSQVMAQPSTVIKNPTEDPSVRDIGSVNAPKLEFSLPRAVRFEYGDQLGEKTEPTYQLTSDTLEPGDYYINESTGFVYTVQSKADGVATMKYEATLQAPAPGVNATSKSTYKQNESGKWVQTEPEVLGSYSDDANKKGWNLQFTFPQFPNVELKETFIGSSEKGSSSVAPVGENLLRFTFNIPRGSRIFAGNEVTKDALNTTIANAELGDYYINTDVSNKTSGGDVYQLIEGNTWQLEGNIRGPVGEKLSTVASYTLSDQSGTGIDGVAATDSLEDTAPVVETLYGQPLKNYELIAVNYKQDNDITSYWYFQTSGAWDRVRITGGVGQILTNEYVDTSVGQVEATYTVDYVNKLITETPQESEKNIKAYSAKKVDDLIGNVKLTWKDFDSVMPETT